jgi:iron only hydrogenase large subunit-like protein
MFFEALKHGERMSIVVAPSIRTNFPDDYKRLLGYFRAAGINKIYDVSFGAEITVWAYLKHLQESGDDSIIAQPCPVVVNSIEKFNASLLSRLAPVHSPLLCAAIYMKEYMGINDKIAFISPCIAKKDEISDRNTGGYVSYNVTFRKLKEHLDNNNIDLRQFEEDDYDNNPAELGVVFSKPGGLKENVAYHDSTIWVKQVEGPQVNFAYLDQYVNRINEGKIIPQIVDILNCEKGCNIGTGSIIGVNDDDADYIMHSKKNYCGRVRQTRLRVV